MCHFDDWYAFILRVDKRFYKPAVIERWVVVVYERIQRFNQQNADEMTAGLLASCKDVGKWCLDTNVVMFYF